MLASEKMEELKTRKNCVPAGYGLFDRRVVHIAYPVVQRPYAAVVLPSPVRFILEQTT